jgi:hypothetical protein
MEQELNKCHRNAELNVSKAIRNKKYGLTF